MKLPNAVLAIVDIDKLKNYSLSASHGRGRHKARVFAAMLELTADDAEALRAEILAAIDTFDAVPTEQDGHGQRYRLDFLMTWMDNQAIVRTTWIIRQSENFPRLTSCYVLKERRER